jgi:hypothetical protein
LISYFVIPKVSVVAERAQEIILVERGASAVRLVREWVGTDWVLALIKKRVGVQEYALLPVASAATRIAKLSSAATAATGGQQGDS